MKLSMQKQIENGVCFKFELPENHYGSLLRVSDLADLLHICCIVLEGATDVIFRFFFLNLAAFHSFNKVDYQVGGFMKENRVATFEVVMNVKG